MEMLVDAIHAVPRPVINLHANNIVNDAESADISDEKSTITTPMTKSIFFP
jgi:hypothetical protein